MVHETTERDPERIYLEPWPYSPEGRLWSEENVWPLYTWPPEPEDESPRALGVEYIRADLHDAEIARLARELEAARELLRELAGGDEAGLAWDRGWRCVYCDSRARYTVLHDRDCPIARARRVVANTDTAGSQSADREERRESD